jgi:adenylylsulfate kinase-like enzyme
MFYEKLQNILWKNFIKMSLSPRACTIWFTGLSGNGRTMIIDDLAPQLKARGCRVEILDEEVVRVDVNWNFVLSHGDRGNNLQRLALTCLQAPASGAFVIFPAGSFEDSSNHLEVVCDTERESPRASAQKILRKLEQLKCFTPFYNNDRDAFSDEEEALVARRLKELGYV